MEEWQEASNLFLPFQSLQEGWAWQGETSSHLCYSQKRRGPQSAPASWSQRSFQGGGLEDEEGPKSTATEGAEEKTQAEVNGPTRPLRRRYMDGEHFGAANPSLLVPPVPSCAPQSSEKTSGVLELSGWS